MFETVRVMFKKLSERFGYEIFYYFNDDLSRVYGV